MLRQGHMQKNMCYWRRFATILTVCLVATAGISLWSEAAEAARSVPPGNRYQTQPRIPFASARRTAADKSSYDAKFHKVLDMLRDNSGLLDQIKSVSARYKIDPIHVIGAIVGEHTYNYDTLDTAQGYYMKALTYAGINMQFEYRGEKVTDFVNRPQFKRCHSASNSHDSNRMWTCYEDIWDHTFRGKRVDGQSFPNANFNETFFQPLYAGQSFGLGQLTPLTALKMTDMVHRISGYSKLSPTNAPEVYRSVMDPHISLNYTAAVIKDSIDAYRQVAGVDISDNPGLTATLYNLGDPWQRAAAFRNSGKTWPAENYYGWLVNDRLDDLKALLK